MSTITGPRVARYRTHGTDGASSPGTCILAMTLNGRHGSPQRSPRNVEASRGCKHLCRHCPVVPVYNGRFRIIPLEIVLGDVRQQVAAGARHITFGDPDFFNGPTHALRIVRAVSVAGGQGSWYRLYNEPNWHPVPSVPAKGARVAPAQLSEPWYCCAEPTEEQFAI
jgi:hypothetical protein